MAEHEPQTPGRPPGEDENEPDTSGTIFFMLVFLMALGGMWLIMFLELLRR